MSSHAFNSASSESIYSDIELFIDDDFDRVALEVSTRHRDLRELGQMMFETFYDAD